jgi:hypothetical protein
MKLFDLENELEKFALGCDCDCKSHRVDPIPQFQLERWPWFCIDHPNVGDCIVFKVSAEVHPRGIQMILCTPALVNASFKHYTLCVRKQGCIFHTFFSLGGWWFLLGVDKDQMRSISKVFTRTINFYFIVEPFFGDRYLVQFYWKFYMRCLIDVDMACLFYCVLGIPEDWPRYVQRLPSRFNFCRHSESLRSLI